MPPAGRRSSRVARVDVGVLAQGPRKSAYRLRRSVTGPGGTPKPEARADSQRNRAKILTAAGDAFALGGPEVSLDVVAARAGVGAGIVHRHFPTKQALLSAVVAASLNHLADAAERLDGDPAADFFDFLTDLGAVAGRNLVLTSALGGDLGPELNQAAVRLSTALDRLLRAAQRAGAVRPDLDVEELHAILTGALTIEQRLPSARAGLGLEIVLAGLRPNQPPT
jgi:AcrR family transcriptional regulator